MQLRLKEPSRYRAIFVDARETADPFLECLLGDRGMMLVGRYASLREFSLLRSLPEADLFIVYLARVDGTELRDLRLAGEAFGGPVMVMTESDEPSVIQELIDAGAHSILCTAASSDRVRLAAGAAVGNHERLRRMNERADRAERALEERKLIERAKGILMQQRGISEHEALRELQRKSMHRNESLPVVARTIIDAKELLG